MKFFELPAYNKARQLTMQLMESTQKVPRDMRYTYIRDAILVGMGIMEHIAFANDDINQRISFLESSIEDVHSIMIKVRIMYDLHHISHKGYDAIIRIENELESQLVGWHKSTIKNFENKSKGR